MRNFLSILVLLALLGGVVFGAYVLVVKEDPRVIGEESEGLEAIRPRNMRIDEILPGSFVVRWETVEAVSGYVKYGDTSNSVTLMAQDVNGAVPSNSHEVRVSDLMSGKKYYFWVMSDDVAFGRNGRALEVLTLSQ